MVMALVLFNQWFVPVRPGRLEALPRILFQYDRLSTVDAPGAEEGWTTCHFHR
jgi:hypothetical protein